MRKQFRRVYLIARFGGQRALFDGHKKVDEQHHFGRYSSLRIEYRMMRIPITNSSR